MQKGLVIDAQLFSDFSQMVSVSMQRRRAMVFRPPRRRKHRVVMSPVPSSDRQPASDLCCIFISDFSSFSSMPHHRCCHQEWWILRQLQAVGILALRPRPKHAGQHSELTRCQSAGCCCLQWWWQIPFANLLLGADHPARLRSLVLEIPVATRPAWPGLEEFRCDPTAHFEEGSIPGSGVDGHRCERQRAGRTPPNRRAN